MKTVIFVSNITIILIFIFYIISTIIKFIKHKNSKAIPENAIIINKPKELAYSEKLAEKLLLIAIIVTLIMSIGITIFTVSVLTLRESIVPLYLPMMLINLWIISYEKKLGFIITKDGVKVGFHFIKWNKIKDYEWKTHKKDHNKIILKIGYVSYLCD